MSTCSHDIMEGQAPLPGFDGTPLDPRSIEAKFLAFHAAHPEVYVGLEQLALQALAHGRRRVGIGHLVEVLRWHTTMGAAPGEAEFKINNSFRSRYARLLIGNHPDLGDLIETRVLTTYTEAPHDGVR